MQKFIIWKNHRPVGHMCYGKTELYHLVSEIEARERACVYVTPKSTIAELIATLYDLGYTVEKG